MSEAAPSSDLAGSAGGGGDQLGRDLAGLEKVINKSAAGTARTSVRVQTYARDTGAIITVQLFVLGQRYGVSLLGWSSDA